MQIFLVSTPCFIYVGGCLIHIIDMSRLNDKNIYVYICIYFYHFTVHSVDYLITHTNTCTHTHTHTHTHIYIYIYIYKCACVGVCN